jgi:hypothetical protein
MSTTYTLACDTCKKKHWAGQSKRLYDTAFNFLHDHLGCNLRFMIDAGDDDDPSLYYEEIKYKEEE